MHLNVQRAIRPWLIGEGPYGEGKVPWMHKDRRGLVTIGIGNQIHDLEKHPKWNNPLKYRHKQGKTVTKADIKADHERVKNFPPPYDESSFESITMLRLKKNAMTDLVNQKLNSLEHTLINSHWYNQFGFWPADAQMAILGLAYACGDGAVCSWPEFREACKHADFIKAAEHCHYKVKGKSEQGQPLHESASAHKRNADIKIMFHNASFVLYEIIENDSDIRLGDLIFPSAKSAKGGWKPKEWPLTWKKIGCTLTSPF